MGRVIFLTGGTGFIGTHVAERLLNEPDAELVVLVMAAEGAPEGRAPEHGACVVGPPRPRRAIGRNVRSVPATSDRRPRHARRRTW